MGVGLVEGGGGQNKAVIGATVLVGRWPVPPLSTHNGRVQTGQGKHPEIVIFMMESKLYQNIQKVSWGLS